jgi:uncharacterized membrane protein
MVCFLAGLLESGGEVRIVSPTNGTVFPAYATVRIEVQPEFAGGESSVKYGMEPDYYYPEGYLIAEVKAPPYSLTLSNVPAGNHRYVVWTGEADSPRSSVEIVVTNPPTHVGPFWFSKVMENSSAVGINNHGVIVVNAGGYAYTWRDGEIRKIPMPEGETGSGADINDAGEITGAYDAGGKTRAFIYRNGRSMAIEIPGATSSAGTKVSPHGDVTGLYWNAESELGFLYTSEGVLFTNEPASASIVFSRWPISLSINSYGVFAGTTNAEFQPKAFLRGVGPDGIEHRLPEMWRSRAEGINDAAQVLIRGRKFGNWDFMDDEALLYSHFRVQGLGGISGENRPQAVNKWGQAVGEAWQTIYGRHGAFEGYGKGFVMLWSGGQVRDLNSLVDNRNGWVLQHAVGINDHGQIVGSAWMGGMQCGYLLNPRPKLLNVAANDSGVMLTVHHRPGTTLKVQSSADLRTWASVLTNSAAMDVREVTLPPEEHEFKFYRLLDDEVIEEKVMSD